MNSKDIGNLGEHLAVVEFLKKGIIVSRPLGDNARYDLILDINENIYTCQVKSTASSSSELAEFWLSSSQAHRGKSRSLYSVDIFCLVDINNNKVFILPNIDDRKSIKIRYTIPTGINNKYINMWYDYTLDKFIDSI